MNNQSPTKSGHEPSPKALDAQLFMEVVELLTDVADHELARALLHCASRLQVVNLAVWRVGPEKAEGAIHSSDGMSLHTADAEQITSAFEQVDADPAQLGQHATAAEATHVTSLFPGCDVGELPVLATSFRSPHGIRFLVAFIQEPEAARVPPAELEDTVGLLCSTLSHNLDDSNCSQEVDELTHVLNFSDSIYASWHAEEGWHYHNINGMLQLGHRREDVSLRTAEAINPMHPDDWQQALHHFEKTLREGEGYQQDYRALGANERSDIMRWYRAELTVTEKDGRGGARELITISRDITRIKKAADEAVQRARLEKWLVARAKAIFNCYDFASMDDVLEDLGRHLGVDRCVLRVVDPHTLATNLMAEWHTPELTKMAELTPEVTAKTGVKWIRQLLERRETYAVADVVTEVPSERLRNYYQSIDTRACIIQPLIHGDELTGALNLLSTTARNWTASDQRIAKEVAEFIHLAILRNRLLDELRATDERFQLAMESATYGLWDTDIAKGTIYYSPQFYERLGYPVQPDPIPIEQMANYIHKDDFQFLLERDQGSDNFVDLELRHIRSDGSWVWLLTRGKVLKRNKGGRCLRYLGVNLDISEHKAAQAGLRQAREMAEEANRAKSEFLERMSHEIRTPMNAIVGMSYLALQTGLNQQQKSYLEDIDGATQSLLHIIDDILDFSKIESGELAVVHKRFELRGELERLIKLFAPRADQAGNVMRLKVDDDVPSFVVGDKNRLGQVISNLLSNAVKFTKEGEIVLHVQCADLDERINSVTLAFSVSDSGIGLSQEQMETVFEPFVQAEGSTSRKYGGTGLGLSICKHLVQMMGGSINCTSSSELGTTFEFTVVFKQNTVEDQINNVEETPLPSSQKVESGTKVRRRRVLLAEDNPVNRRVATGILQRFDVEVMSAENGAEAIEVLKRHPDGYFDAVLMDIEMPEMDGLTATALIRQEQRFSRLPVIAMTAHAMVGDRERCLAAGMNDHIPKPVKPELLRDVLSRFWNTASTPSGDPPVRETYRNSVSGAE